MSKWTEIKNYPNYVITDDGKVKSKITNKILTGGLNESGYVCFTLKNENGKRIERAHRLVAETFIKNPNNEKIVNHINGIKTDNRVENLEWSTPTENSIHAHKNGLTNVARGERQRSAKLTVDKVKFIRESTKTVRELALMFNVSKQAIRDVKMNRSWKHVC